MRKRKKIVTREFGRTVVRGMRLSKASAYATWRYVGRDKVDGTLVWTIRDAQGRPIECVGGQRIAEGILNTITVEQVERSRVREAKERDASDCATALFRALKRRGLHPVRCTLEYVTLTHGDVRTLLGGDGGDE